MPQINFMALDVSSIPSIPWENRGTWGQAIELGGGSAAAATRPSCVRPSTRVRLHTRRGRIVRARVYENSRLVRTARGRSLHSVTVPFPRGSRPVLVMVVAYTRRGGKLISTRVYRPCSKTRRRNRYRHHRGR